MLDIDTSAKLDPEWYTPIGFQDDPDPPQFLLTPVPNTVAAGCRLSGMTDRCAEYLKHGVTDWRNVNNQNGPCPFDWTLLIKPQCFPTTMVVELYGRLLAMSTMFEAEKKTLESPST